MSFLPAYAPYLFLARGGIVAVCAGFLLVRRGVGDRTVCFFVDAAASYGGRLVRLGPYHRVLGDCTFV